MSKNAIWNVAGGAIATACVAIIGWLALSVIDLQNKNAAKDAEYKLRNEITDVLGDVDKRLAVIEAVMVLSNNDITSPASLISPIPAPALELPLDPPEDKSSSSEFPNTYSPRYNLRNQTSQNINDDQ